MNKLIPKELYLSSHGVMGDGRSITSLEGDKLRWTVFSADYDDERVVEVTPNDSEWAGFIKLLDEIDIWSWKTDYTDPNVLDGFGWSVKIRVGDKHIETGGMNATPGDSFIRFIEGVRTLFGDKEWLW